ncbi:MAG: hypothetical protein ABW039_00050, partial [Sphingobium sp.]
PDNGAYAYGEGSRCLSNEGGKAAFLAAVQAANIPEGERRALALRRTALEPDCAGAAGLAGDPLADKRSEEGRAWGAYLEGAEAFYGATYDKARTQFESLKAARNPWLRETALYMIGRVELNRAQVDAYDEYGDRKQDQPIDSQRIRAADEGLRDYLKAYPKGIYAASARGLLRRVYWLAGDHASLSGEYALLFSNPLPGLDDGRLAEEIDDKLLSAIDASNVSDPMLLAVSDLQNMRKAEHDYDEGCCGEPIAAAALDAQRLAFAKMPALFDYLRAARAWYVDASPANVLQLIPDAARQSRFTAIEFSRQMLRGIALEAIKDRNARGFWIEMLPGAKMPWQRAAVELAIALHDERAGALARIFEAGSPVETASIREILLINIADAGLLRQQAKDGRVPRHERDVALFTLLYKSVSRGQYRAFVDDLALVPAGASTDNAYWSLREAEKPPLGLFTRPPSLGDYGCPPLRTTATQLSANARDSRARLCLADFMRANGFDGIGIDTQPTGDQLGSMPTLFAGSPYSRLEVYKTIIADPVATAADKAYALYRAVNCYGPSGNNSCGGAEVSKEVRRAWYLQLKKDYPQSRWAGQLRYYW